MYARLLVATLLLVMAGSALADEAPRHGALTVLRQVPVQTRVAALTIDLGESARPGAVEGMLESLDKRGINVTWFVTGWFVRHHPELLVRMAERGDHFGNHTDTHPHCRQVSAGRLARELSSVESLLQAHGLAVTEPRYFRPPYGEYDRAVIDAAAALSYRTVIWSATTDDYTARRDPTACARLVLRRVRPGGIILIHATPVSRWMLPTLLDGLAEGGYSVVPLQGLLDTAHRE